MMVKAAFILFMLELTGCGLSRASGSAQVTQIIGPPGVTCYAISDGDRIVGGNCIKD